MLASLEVNLFVLGNFFDAFMFDFVVGFLNNSFKQNSNKTRKNMRIINLRRSSIYHFLGKSSQLNNQKHM
jgi:hypothetical protein